MVWAVKTEVFRRNSKHEEMDQEGRRFLNLIGEGYRRGDTVIDYILASEREYEE